MDLMTVQLRQRELDWREIDDEIVVLDGREATYSAVRGSGTLVWRLLAQATTRQRLVEAVVDCYDVSEEQAGRDVDAFLATLREKGFLAG
jgi:hypothetical protein